MKLEGSLQFWLIFGVVHIRGDVEKNWSTKTLYHGLWARSILSSTRYFAISAMLHVVDPATKEPQNKLRTVESFKEDFQKLCKDLYVPQKYVTLTTNPLTARCSALSVKSCLCSNALLGVFAYVQWSHRDKFKQQIQRWNLLVFCKYKGNEWILWLIIDGYYLNLGKRKAEVKINAPAKFTNPFLLIRRGDNIYN